MRFIMICGFSNHIFFRLSVIGKIKAKVDLKFGDMSLSGKLLTPVSRELLAD